MDVIRKTVGEFYARGMKPSARMVFKEVKRRTAGTEHEFPYGAATCWKILKNMGIQVESGGSCSGGSSRGCGSSSGGPCGTGEER